MNPFTMDYFRTRVPNQDNYQTIRVYDRSCITGNVSSMRWSQYSVVSLFYILTCKFGA